MKRKLTLADGSLMISGAAFIFLTTPAWFQGMAAAAAAVLLLWLTIWRVNPDWDVKKSLSPDLLCLGLVITSAFGCNFYNTWLDSGYVLKIAQLIYVRVEPFLFLVSAVGVLISLPAVTAVLSGGLQIVKREFAEKHKITAGKCISAKLTFWVLFLVFLLGFSAVLRTNFYYMDDNGRAAFGYKTWDYFGRYLSTGFSTLLHMGDYLTDIAPLPQVVALLIMALSGVLLLYILYERTSFYWWEVAAVVPLALNPYFLECLSFRFDAPYMALSVLAGIVPLLYRNQKIWVYLLASMLGILAVCTSYQAAAGIFPILVIILVLRMWNRGESFWNAILFGLRSAFGYGLGLIYFKLVIMKPADAVYVSNALPEASDLIGNTLDNFKTYYSLILTDFKPFWLILAALMIVVFVYRTISSSEKKKPAALCMTVAALFLMLLLCFGIYPVLESTLFSPRAMYGFGVMLTIFCVVTVEGEGRFSLKMPALVLSWVFFVFSFTYGNALNVQKEYTEFRIRMVMEDLNELVPVNPGEKISTRISGGIGLSPVLENMPQDYEMLNRLVPESFAGGDDLSEYRFRYYYGLQDAATHGTEEECPDDMPILKDGIFHTIRGEKDRVLIELK